MRDSSFAGIGRLADYILAKYNISIALGDIGTMVSIFLFTVDILEAIYKDDLIDACAEVREDQFVVIYRGSVFSGGSYVLTRFVEIEDDIRDYYKTRGYFEANEFSILSE